MCVRVRVYVCVRVCLRVCVMPQPTLPCLNTPLRLYSLTCVCVWFYLLVTAAFEAGHRALLVQQGAVIVASLALLLHVVNLEMCQFHCVFLFFVRKQLVKAITRGSAVTVDLCHHVRGE